MEFFVYAGVLVLAMLVFLRMARGYSSRTIDGDGSSTESSPLLRQHSRVISVHTASTSSRPFSSSCLTRDSSAASCLGRMERARTSAWPTCTLVHVGTPSTNDKQATTLAQD